jgi:hypothetical protein
MIDETLFTESGVTLLIFVYTHYWRRTLFIMEDMETPYSDRTAQLCHYYSHSHELFVEGDTVAAQKRKQTFILPG